MTTSFNSSCSGFLISWLKASALPVIKAGPKVLKVMFKALKKPPATIVKAKMVLVPNLVANKIAKLPKMIKANQLPKEKPKLTSK